MAALSMSPLVAPLGLGGPAAAVFSTCAKVQCAAGGRSGAGKRLMIIRATAPKGTSSGPAINNLGDTLAQSIEDAQQACAGNDQSEECAAAWDEVENVSAAVSDAKAKNKGKGDPLEEYCEDNPEADECRVYSD